MKKKLTLIVLLVCSVLLSCNNEYHDDSEDALNMQLANENFLKNIDYIDFDYSEDNEEFLYASNGFEFSFLLSDVELVHDSILKIEYALSSPKIESKYKSTVFKNLKTVPSGGILLSFDDYYSTWSESLSYFDNYDLHATWFCKGGEINDFMTTAQSKGHTIGYHGKNHTMLLYLDYYKDGVFDQSVYDKFSWETYHFL